MFAASNPDAVPLPKANDLSVKFWMGSETAVSKLARTRVIPSVATLLTNKNSEVRPIRVALDGVGTAKTIAIEREMARGSKDLPAQTFRAPDLRSSSECAIRFSTPSAPRADLVLDRGHVVPRMCRTVLETTS